jgi:hypothetical protein
VKFVFVCVGWVLLAFLVWMWEMGEALEWAMLGPGMHSAVHCCFCFLVEEKQLSISVFLFAPDGLRFSMFLK